MLTAKDFEKINFWEDTTPEENITVYGMDFDEAYIFITDDNGTTPVDPKKSLIVAAYDEANSFLWFNELPNFATLEAICQGKEPASQELFEAIRTYVKPQK